MDAVLDFRASIEKLNAKYEPLSVYDRIEALYKDFDIEDVLLTSSFAANSAFLLHLFSKATKSSQKIHFIDTSYHFPETLAYKQELTDRYRLQVFDVKAEASKNEFTRKDETWRKDPDFCCFINKVEPLQEISLGFKVWVSGLMRSQNEHRKNLRVFEEKNGMFRFYPIIDVTPEFRDEYMKQYELPFHPLVMQGYQSIGCSHCTKKGEGREGRWVGLAKTECGLHL